MLTLGDTGSEDADVIRIQAKLRLKENTKWFNQWFNLINWRTMSKVSCCISPPLLRYSFVSCHFQFCHCWVF